MDKLSNNQVIKKIIEDVNDDMTNEEVINLLVEKNVSKNATKKDLTLGQKAADKFSKFAGSWTFIIIFFAVLLAWIVINIVFAINAFDPYPFILLNLFLSCIAAVQAPIIMMSQNRQEQLDRRRSENDYLVNLKTEIIIKDMHEKLTKLIKNQEKIIDRLDIEEKNRK